MPGQIDLGQISSEDPNPSVAPDELTGEEQRTLESDRARVEIEGLAQDIQERKNYANKLFNLIKWWLVAVLTIVVVSGALSPWKVFNLSDGVLLSLIGGTTGSVIGLFVVVANYLFPKRK